MEKDIVEFIHRRFPYEERWVNGNCYYFAIILKERFGGKLYYDPIVGHFYCKINKEYYDWFGKHTLSSKKLINFKKYKKIDKLHYNRIIRDCKE